MVFEGTRRRSAKSVLLVCAIFLFIAGCGTSAVETTNPAGNEPVKLTMFQKGTILTDDEFQQYIAGPVNKKYHNVTVDIVRDGKGTSAEDLLAGGTFPDLIYTSNPSIPTFEALGILDDLLPLIKKNKFDLANFPPSIIDAIKQYAGHGELYAIPFSQNYAVLVYNKSIFDKFATPYPSDNMTWEDTIALSKKLTVMVDGTQYIGIDPGTVGNMRSYLSLPIVDPKTNKAVINTDGWAKVLTVMKEMYSIPGFIGENKKYIYALNSFMKDKNLAMFPVNLDNLMGRNEDVDWDLATLPHYKEAPGRGREMDIHLLMVSKLSKNKDWAMRAIAVATSDEVQTEMTQNGRMSALNDSKYQKMFASKFAPFKGKHVEAIFKAAPGAPHMPSIYDPVVNNLLNAAVKDLALGNKDVNTLLREVQEAADKAIAEETK